MGKIIGYNLLTSGENSSTNNVVTSSITIAPQRLLLFFVAHSAATTINSISGASMTFTSLGTVTYGSTRGTLYHAMSASGGTGAITISLSGTALVQWIAVEFYNVKTSGTNGSDAIAQVNSAGENSTDNQFDISLPVTFADPNNASVGFAYFNGNVTLGANSPYTQIATAHGNHDSSLIFSQERSTPASFTHNQNGEIVGFAVEIAAMKFGAGIMGIL